MKIIKLREVQQNKNKFKELIQQNPNTEGNLKKLQLIPR